jgi:hypothetical protein
MAFPCLWLHVNGGSGLDCPAPEQPDGFHSESCYRLPATYSEVVTRLQNRLKEEAAKTPANPYRIRIEELLCLPARERIPAIELEMKHLSPQVSDDTVYFHKSLLRLWDAARIEAGVVTAAQVQRENSPVTYEQMAEARLVFEPRLRV